MACGHSTLTFSGLKFTRTVPLKSSPSPIPNAPKSIESLKFPFTVSQVLESASHLPLRQLAVSADTEASQGTDVDALTEALQTLHRDLVNEEYICSDLESAQVQRQAPLHRLIQVTQEVLGCRRIELEAALTNVSKLSKKMRLIKR